MECDNDFVISNVTTIDEDDEPLLEVTRVTVLKEKKTYPVKVRSEFNHNTSVRQDIQGNLRVTKYKKICYVPLCPNTSISTPEKMFITVPVNPVRRKMWLDVVGKTNGKNPKSPMFCCQDHFNLEKDMKNYEEHLKLGRVQMLLYQTAVPHIFLCNEYGHLKRPERLAVLRDLHKERFCKRVFEEEDEEDEDEEEYSPSIEKQTQISRKTPRQRTQNEANRSTNDMYDVLELQSDKPVFVEMPLYEFEDQPEYVKVKEVVEQNHADTIVIDDSDDEGF